jgi:hypothetical protein
MEVIKRIREWNADVVIAPRSNDIILTIATQAFWYRMPHLW